MTQELWAWTKGLQAWQSDAVSRLLAKKELTPADHDELYALLKVAHGIPDLEQREPLPLAENQIPAPIQAETDIELLFIKNLRNVTAIADNQQLEVGAKGLTVIYGANGSGKSGYSRVLKRACRARDQSEHILPNANVAGAKMGNYGSKVGSHPRSCRPCRYSTLGARVPTWTARTTLPTCHMGSMFWMTWPSCTKI